MIIGIFGLSGSGKSYLSNRFSDENPDFIAISASKIISDAKKEISLNSLNTAIVTDNQYALITGFCEFCKNNRDKNILIELHNIIETKDGIVEIKNDVFYKLNLDAGCFISPSIDNLHAQRRDDNERNRFNSSPEKLKEFQRKAINNFKKINFKSNEKLIIETDVYNHFCKYIDSLINKHTEE